MLGRLVPVDQAVMRVAEQHEVFDVIREPRRPTRVAPRSVRSGRDDVCDVGAVERLCARNYVAEQIRIAADVLAAAAGSGPQDQAIALGYRSCGPSPGSSSGG